MVEIQDNSAGISHKQEILVFPDPVPEVVPAPVVQGGEASVGEGVGDPLAEEFSKTVDDCLPETGLARVFCTSKAVDLMLMLLLMLIFPSLRSLTRSVKY